MNYIDMHSHWATRRGYALQSEEELAKQAHTWRSHPNFRSEEEMAQDLRQAGVKAILDFGYTKYLPPEQAHEIYAYGFEYQREHPDVVLGNWIHVQPEAGRGALDLFRGALDTRAGFVGLAASGSGGVPASDIAYRPFYELCIEANVPALIFVGTTGLGAGFPGGRGIVLDNCHPRHLDLVAARFPKLKIVAARPGWPWQTETIAVLLHKANIVYELHGWSPKYLTEDLKHEIGGRLQNRVMFGADYPLFSYERLVRDWHGLGFSEEVLTKVFHRNAERFLAEVGR